MGAAATTDLGLAAGFEPKLRIERVSSYRDFLDLEPEWTRIVQSSRVDHPFLEHAWLRTWWECFGEGSTLQILVAKSANRVIGIAPLILTPIRMYGMHVRRLGFFYNAHVPRAGFVVAERSDDVHRAFWDTIAADRNWDVLQVCQLPESSPTLESIRKFARAERYPAGTWLSGESPYVPLHTSWQEYTAALPAKHRSNLRNRIKRINNEVGPAALETVARDVSEAVRTGLQIEAAAWKGEAGTAINNDRALTMFYTSFAERAAERGWMRLHLLKAGEKHVAFDYSLLYRDRMHLLKLGYDPEFSKYSPSNLLLGMVLEKAFQQRIGEYDFLGEVAEWKMCWAQHTLPHYWLYVFAPTAKGRLLHSIKFRLIPWLKRLRGGA